MENQIQAIGSSSEKDLFIKMVVSNWDLQNKRINGLLSQLSDEQLLAEVAPGKNRGIYLLGHLAAVSDGMLPLLGFGEKLYPELESVFVTNPDNSGLDMPLLEDVKKFWHETNAKVSEYISQMAPEEWFTKHTAVSEEDFAKEPHRNKLNILMNRTGHHSYHLGQLIFLK